MSEIDKIAKDLNVSPQDIMEVYFKKNSNELWGALCRQRDKEGNIIGHGITYAPNNNPYKGVNVGAPSLLKLDYSSGPQQWRHDVGMVPNEE